MKKSGAYCIVIACNKINCDSIYFGRAKRKLLVVTHFMRAVLMHQVYLVLCLRKDKRSGCDLEKNIQTHKGNNLMNFDDGEVISCLFSFIYTQKINIFS